MVWLGVLVGAESVADVCGSPPKAPLVLDASSEIYVGVVLSDFD